MLPGTRHATGRTSSGTTVQMDLVAFGHALNSLSVIMLQMLVMNLDRNSRLRLPSNCHCLKCSFHNYRSSSSADKLVLQQTPI